MRVLEGRFLKLSIVLSIILLLLVNWPSLGQASSSVPILVVVNDSYPSNTFGRYLGEILRAEGLNAFEIINLGTLTAADLTNHDLTILAETSLTSGQATMLTDYVNGGGRLLAMRPDAQIRSLFGLGASAGVLNDGYLKINNSVNFNGFTPGQGLVGDTLQIHGAANRYTILAGAVILAQLYSDASTATPYPAVIGSGTGRAVAFTYDLARNVIYTRQGNPANANIDINGDGVLRTEDLFQTSGGGAPWIDRDRIPIPQADEQQRLFARLVQQLVSSVQPLPQLWYFPGNAKTMLILTGDAHGNLASAFQNEINSINSRGGKITLYIANAADPDNANVQTWRGQGHEFGLHPSGPPTVTSLDQGYNIDDTWFAGQFTSPKSRTVRNHQLAWKGWTDAADIAVGKGIALEMNFYHWGNWLRKSNNTWPHGYITGSGQPMKFIRADGTILPLYQQLTQLADEQLLNGVGAGYEGLNATQAVAVSQQLIDASLAGNYAALTAQFHVDHYGLAITQNWAEGTMDYALSKGVPLWNADRWLNFTEVRHDANYSNLNWNSTTGTLNFTLNATSTSGITLTTMLPVVYQGRSLQSVTVDGSAVSHSIQTVKGLHLAFVAVPAGIHSFSALYQAGTSTPPSGNATQSTFEDFNQSCAVLANTHVSDQDGGSVMLAATQADDFNGTVLNPSLWSSGNWGGGSYTPTVSGGLLTIQTAGGGWVRSQATYTHGTIEAIAEFGTGPNQHIGFGSNGFAGDRYFIFSTHSGDGNLYARANNSGSEQTANLGLIPTGKHRYRIEWSALNSGTDRVRFYLDGLLQFQADVSNGGATNFYLYLSNAADASPLRIDAAQAAPPYVSSGNYTSCVLDAGVGNAWQTANWEADIPAMTGLTVETRTSFDSLIWGPWAAVPGNGSAISQPRRYAQYRLLFTTSNSQRTAIVNSVVLDFGLNLNEEGNSIFLPLIIK